MPPVQKFEEGEKVLCFHGPLLYEAKCLKVETSEVQVKYFMHYAGWNKNWDEWVHEDRILKYNETGLQRQKELKAAHTPKRPKTVSTVKKEPEKEKVKEAEKEKKEKSENKKDKEKKDKEKDKDTKKHKVADATQDPPPKKKRLKEPPGVESEEAFMSRIEVKIKIPDELKCWLVDDWDLMTRQNSLYQLPAKKTVEEVLQEYVKYKAQSSKSQQNKEVPAELTVGIREYFNVTLGTQLLYKQERPQYADMKSQFPDSPMTELYGTVHLLRLFVKLGAMLAYTNLGERSMTFVLNNIHDFLRYLSKNRHVYFLKSDYQPATPEYIRRTL